MNVKKKRSRSWQHASLQIRYRFLFALLFLSLFFFLPGTGYSTIITLTWDLNENSEDIAGYKVYTGTSAGTYGAEPVCYTDSNENSCAVSVSNDGKTHYYAVTAYNKAGLESDYSNEVSYKAPAALIKYTITSSSLSTYSTAADPTSGTGGSIYPSGSVTVSAGGTCTFQIRPSTGFKISRVLVDGINKGTPTSYTFSNVKANHTIVVLFSPE
ncbi:hypothetical protein SAMN04489760_11952 [Syntrophus gentianae]|uniref:Fibronectin type-III domain-containing protein n=1 Tax=Syntrophus gentianae TaxID=43775 RepID=A0A1H7Z047_9BACT|nr:hypothetical protein [Syntrophus gentianae]SEM51800.1 hypothetical protein SAMN04489760_11952 [Syntrophus gentianae]